MKKREVHGLTNHPLYRKWQDMKNRCYNTNVDRFSSYGGRGIKVCDEWLNSFKSYYNWCMDNGYKKHLTMERKDVNSDYKPSNCCFITLSEQHYNKTNTKKIFYKGSEFCLADLIKKLFPKNYSKAYFTIWSYLKRNNEDELTIELENRYRKHYKEFQ